MVAAVVVWNRCGQRPAFPKFPRKHRLTYERLQGSSTQKQLTKTIFQGAAGFSRFWHILALAALWRVVTAAALLRMLIPPLDSNHPREKQNDAARAVDANYGRSADVSLTTHMPANLQLFVHAASSFWSSQVFRNRPRMSAGNCRFPGWFHSTIPAATTWTISEAPRHSSTFQSLGGVGCNCHCPVQDTTYLLSTYLPFVS